MVLWDLDSQDEHHPGVAAIRANAVGLAQPGSIILMHDGGHHPMTVRALPGVIRGLRARGFHFTTVTALLGGRFIFDRSDSMADGPRSLIPIHPRQWS
jgi:peptidoglycan/xylan/chitin deacetylase (PgdA/CDA1 family)